MPTSELHHGLWKRCLVRGASASSHWNDTHTHTHTRRESGQRDMGQYSLYNSAYWNFVILPQATPTRTAPEWSRTSTVTASRRTAWGHNATHHHRGSKATQSDVTNNTTDRKQVRVQKGCLHFKFSASSNHSLASRGRDRGSCEVHCYHRGRHMEHIWGRKKQWKWNGRGSWFKDKKQHTHTYTHGHSFYGLLFHHPKHHIHTHTNTHSPHTHTHTQN